jgi:hypothetical protein
MRDSMLMQNVAAGTEKAVRELSLDELEIVAGGKVSTGRADSSRNPELPLIIALEAVGLDP